MPHSSQMCQPSMTAKRNAQQTTPEGSPNWPGELEGENMKEAPVILSVILVAAAVISASAWSNSEPTPRKMVHPVIPVVHFEESGFDVSEAFVMLCNEHRIIAHLREIDYYRRSRKGGGVVACQRVVFFPTERSLIECSPLSLIVRLDGETRIYKLRQFYQGAYTHSWRRSQHNEIYK